MLPIFFHSLSTQKGSEGDAVDGWADTKEWEIKHCVQYAVYILALVEGERGREYSLFTLGIKVVTEDREEVDQVFGNIPYLYHLE